MEITHIILIELLIFNEKSGPIPSVNNVIAIKIKISGLTQLPLFLL